MTISLITYYIHTYRFHGKAITSNKVTISTYEKTRAEYYSSLALVDIHF